MTYRDWVKVASVDFQSLSLDEQLAGIESMRKEAFRRQKSFQRAKVRSPALNGLEASLEHIGVDLDEPFKLKRFGQESQFNTIVHTFDRLASFLDGSKETSTLAGARAVERRQDIAIFGSYTRKGKEVARRRMTAEQREKFWDVLESLKQDVRTELLGRGWYLSGTRNLATLWVTEWKNLSFDEQMKKAWEFMEAQLTTLPPLPKSISRDGEEARREAAYVSFKARVAAAREARTDRRRKR